MTVVTIINARAVVGDADMFNRRTRTGIFKPKQPARPGAHVLVGDPGAARSGDAAVTVSKVRSLTRNASVPGPPRRPTAGEWVAQPSRPWESGRKEFFGEGTVYPNHFARFSAGPALLTSVTWVCCAIASSTNPRRLPAATYLSEYYIENTDGGPLPAKSRSRCSPPATATL